MPGEFDLIQRYFNRPSQRADVLLSVGDDCALLQVPPGEALAVSTDTLIAGVHFPHDTPAYDIGWKSLAVNLSDLAAMAATPRWVTLAISLPRYEADWLQAFANGFFALADQHNVALVGGDTTRGPLSITVTVHGTVPASSALRRDRAQLGDIIAVTGSLGDAGRALQHALGSEPIADSADAAVLLMRLNRPTPRVQAALALRPLCHAAIDISDGFVQDLGHVLEASGLGARIDIAALPLSAALQRQCSTTKAAIDLALCAGDDYELCLSVPAAKWPAAVSAAAATGVVLSSVGEVVAGSSVQCVDHGTPYPVTAAGYDHFGVQS